MEPSSPKRSMSSQGSQLPNDLLMRIIRLLDTKTKLQMPLVSQQCRKVMDRCCPVPQPCLSPCLEPAVHKRHSFFTKPIASDPWLCSVCRPGFHDLWGHLCLRDFDESSLYLVYKLAAWLGKRSNGIASLWLRFDGLNYQETTDTGQTRVMASTLPVLVGAMAERRIPLHLSATGDGDCCACMAACRFKHEAAPSMKLLQA